MTKRILNIIELTLISFIIIVCILFFTTNKILILNNKISLTLLLTIPFLIIIILELIVKKKETIRKNIENKISVEFEEFNKLSKGDDLSLAIEQNIVNKMNEIKDSKRDNKKIDNLENTIQISIEEIQQELSLLKEKTISNEISDLDKTTVIVNDSKNLKEEIEKELKIRNSKKNISKKNVN